MNINQHSQRIIAMATLLFLVTSCFKEDISPINNSSEPLYLSEDLKQHMVKLGKKLENPYSVRNMKKAWESLQRKGRYRNHVNVRTTHLYIRFVPEDYGELDLLSKDSTLILWDFPLDHEREEGGVFYRDPTIPIDKPTYQYTAVEVDRNLPEVNYELLAELYIPEDDEQIIIGRRSNVITDLLRESFRLTGNEDDFDEPDLNSQRARWNPSGTIKVEDKRLGRFTGVSGVKVRVNRWFKTKEAITDKNGYFRTSSFSSSKVNYSIRWERNNYSIRLEGIGQAVMNGPRLRKKAWNPEIKSAPQEISHFHAFIHLGAEHYYYGNILGLRRPPQNGTLKPQMKIAAYSGKGQTTHDDDRRFLGIPNQIKMYRKDLDDFILSEERMYNTITHELAHASHWELRKGSWDNGTSDRLKESWAVGASWALTRMRYSSHNTFANLSFSTIRGVGKYNTPIFIDCIDHLNQGFGPFKQDFAFDRVSGYTISQLEAVLQNSRDLNQWKDNLKSSYSNPTEKYLDELVTQYIELKR
ncbi:hypothetical protein QQ008_07590 [Fulvivirgaceae bacterium BMA10]|uniref:Lipoprotein n=1 Tax=Splendidivirga corallicola TaxID=3051826 RepID=A0ABT8KLW1_9BACT|nr:hypothetical protein [Fulvivirgaceae bacterium BMA10]